MALGEILRKARIEKGLTISEVAESTHLLSQVVEGLENENFRRIAAPIYGRGFVKLYAQLLELDPAPLVEDFNRLYRSESEEPSRHRPILAENMPEAKPERITPHKPAPAPDQKPVESVMPPPRITIPGVTPVQEPVAPPAPAVTLDETEKPKVPEVAEMPEITEPTGILETPAIQESPETVAIPETPKPETPEPAAIPAALKNPETLETPVAPVIPETPETSEPLEAAEIQETLPPVEAAEPKAESVEPKTETAEPKADEEDFGPIVPGEPDLFHPYVPPKVDELPQISDEETEERPKRSVFGPLADCTKGLGRGFGELWQDFVLPHSRELLLGCGVALVAVMLGIGIKTLFSMAEKMSRESAVRMIEKCDPPPAMYAD
ncbi:MAG: helix-turn-helix domain-containing protein [Kiritimatiellae bacterium]|nr:helix-turn-helix domain-containing protein [Kiritimatiellia bacterium]